MLKKDKFILGALFLGLMFLIFFRLERKLSFPDQNWPLEKGAKVKINSEIIQKFQADRDGLARIKILFGSSDTKPGGEFAFAILDENCEKIIREKKLSITSLESDNTVDFIFSKIKDSKDKIFCLKINYTQKEGGKKAQIFIIENSRAEKKFLSANGQELAGRSLAIRPAYKNKYFWQDLSELNQRMSQYKPWFLKHYFLWFIVIGFVALSAILVAMLVIL